MQHGRFLTTCFGVVVLLATCPFERQGQHPAVAAQATSPATHKTEESASDRESLWMAKVAQLQSENDALKLQMAEMQRLLQAAERLREARDNIAPNTTIPPDARKYEFNGVPVYIVPIQGSETTRVLPMPK
jgi:hypothetical protein